MDFELSAEYAEFAKTVRAMCSNFSDEYWSDCDVNHRFPQEFFDMFAQAGMLGLCIPEEFGGAGAGVTEAAILMGEIAASGGALNACTTIHVNLFGMLPVIRHGSQEMKSRYLPAAAKGELSIAFGITEPDAGSDTTRISTTAVKVDGGYRINGRKAFISRAAEADRILLITRTSPREQGAKPTDGMTLFFAELDRKHVEIRPIEKLGRNAVSTNWLYIDDLFVPDGDVVGEVGKGFRYLLDGLNPERILVAAECVGIGRSALQRAVGYARDRVVFDRPIGMNQGIQFPLADSLAHLDAAELVMQKAAWLYDRGQPCGREANEAKLLASNAGFDAADRAIQVHGGYGYAREYAVERYWREVRLLRITPLSNELILAFLANHVLDLPRSY
jgi:acyl-CoA dehydrogenase